MRVLPPLRRGLLPLVLLGVLGVPAQAGAFGVSDFSISSVDPTAGAHSDVTISYGISGASEDLRNQTLRLPAGLLGDPRTVPQCTLDQLNADACPESTTVGVIQIDTTLPNPSGDPIPFVTEGTIYNTTPDQNTPAEGADPARLGLVLRPAGGALGNLILLLPIKVRTKSDFGLDTFLTDLPNQVGGVPFDVQRVRITLYGKAAGGKPFMVNPTSCATSTASLEISSYADATPRTLDTTYRATGCDSIPFTPTLQSVSQDPRTDVPSAYDVQLAQPYEVAGRATSNFARVAVALPVGVAFSVPAGAQIASCTEAQFGAKGEPSNCPSSANIGDVTFQSPLIGDLPGSVYFGPIVGPRRYQIYFDARRGNVIVKLKGVISLDPDTGQVTTVFEDLPQTPVERFQLRFRGGDRGVLVNPGVCGAATGSFSATSVAGQTVASPITQTYTQDGAGSCAGADAADVTLGATTAGTAARSDTTLQVDLARTARTSPLRSLQLTLPAGLLGRVYTVPRCPEAGAATGDCPADTRMGSVTATVGAGGSPVTLTGGVFYGPPIGRSLGSLIVVVPGRLGPFDIGNTVVRAQINQDPLTAGIVVNAPLIPAITQGIPLNIRRLQLSIDRPGFLYNSSGCDARVFSATVVTQAASTDTATAPYAATGCGVLPFDPTVQASVEGTRNVARGGRVPFRVRVTQGPGQTALRSVRVRIPSVLKPDVNVVPRACDARRIDPSQCKPNSQIGTATAKSPFLQKPISGPVRFALTDRPPRAGIGTRIPDLITSLTGETDIRLYSGDRIDDAGRLETTFDSIPDVPLDAFTFDVTGGNASPFTLQQELCEQPLEPMQATVTAQDGRTRIVAVPVTAPACAGRPKLAVTATKLRGTRTVVRFVVTAGQAPGKKVRRVRLDLPGQLDAVGSRLKAARITVGTKRVSAKLLKRTKARRLELTLPTSATASKVTVTLSRGAVRLSRLGRRSLGNRSAMTLTFKGVGTESGDRTTNLRAVVRASAR